MKLYPIPRVDKLTERICLHRTVGNLVIFLCLAVGGLELAIFTLLMRM